MLGIIASHQATLEQYPQARAQLLPSLRFTTSLARRSEASTLLRFEVGIIAVTDVQEAQAGYDLAVAEEIRAQGVVEESGDDSSEVAPASRMLLDVSAKIYPTGIIEVQAPLNEPGRYAVILTVDKKDHTGKGQVRLPLQVALGTWPPLLFIGLAAAVAAALYVVYRRFPATTLS